MTSLPPIEIDPKTFLRHHCTLPVLPEIITQIQEVVNSEDVNIGDISDLVGSDPSLAAQILKIVNSAYYSFPREIVDIKFALAYLGISEVYRIVLSLSVVNTLSIADKKELDYFWFHSFFTALSTRFVAKKYEPLVLFDELWVAAILHDIGKLAYLKFFPDHYSVLRRFCIDQGCLFSMAEKHFSFPSSAYIGGLLCIHWGLPEKIKIACESHSFEDLINERIDNSSYSYTQIISIGSLLAVMSSEELNNELKLKLVEGIKKVLNCSESDFLTLMAEIYELKLSAENFK